MLTYATDEFAPYLRAAVTDAGWGGPDDDLLLLGDLQTSLYTVGHIADLQQVVSMGDPNSPRAELLDALVQSPANLFLTDTALCERTWQWYSSAREVTDLILDETAFASCRHEVQSIGLPYRIVEPTATWVDRMRQAGWGTAFLATDAYRPEELRVASQLPAITTRSYYGLVRSDAAPDPTAAQRSLVWVAWTSPALVRGALADILHAVSDLGADLRAIRSGKLESLERVFFATLAFQDVHRLDDLSAFFTEHGVSHRILAQMADPGAEGDTVQPLTPAWTLG
ncbi:MAG: hypothetical protein LKF88_05150 [Microbacteriaceae bacterium]|jgi:hypothetical protein|nr:hypothetical protein [Microbacteriaceae bacterium]MCI1207498.1 hypothetical protein [Microbacteriaceae bacterium]